MRAPELAVTFLLCAIILGVGAYADGKDGRADAVVVPAIQVERTHCDRPYIPAGWTAAENENENTTGKCPEDYIKKTKVWTCRDLTRVLLTSEDGKHYCLKVNKLNGNPEPEETDVPQARRNETLSDRPIGCYYSNGIPAKGWQVIYMDVPYGTYYTSSGTIMGTHIPMCEKVGK